MHDLPKTVKPNKLQKRLLALLPLHKRRKARRVLMAQDSESIRLLSQTIVRERKRRMAGYWIFPLLYFPVLLLSAIFLIIFFDQEHYWDLMNLVLSVAGLLSGAAVFKTALHSLRIKAALEILFDMNDAGCIGPVLDTMYQQPRSLQGKSKAILYRLLPLLTHETFQELSQTQRHTFYSLLDYNLRDTDEEMRLMVLATLRKIRDRGGLGHIYLLATGQAVSPTACAVQAAATDCLAHLQAQVDFGSAHDLPQHIETAYEQIMGVDTLDLPTYFTDILTVRQLLPQLTLTNYRDILSERRRRKLYSLARLRGPHLTFEGGRGSSHMLDLQLEIIHTAERLGDTCALPQFQVFVQSPPPFMYERVHAAICRAVRTLEPLAEREKLSQTLLRGASTPDLQPDELLRAVVSGASATDPAELLRASNQQKGISSYG